MIISFSGRKHCGKTTLCGLVQGGRAFTKISFADRLKELVSELYGINLSTLYSQVGKESKLSEPLVWDDSMAKKLELLSCLPTRSLDRSYAEFRSVREALQHIGTDVLRKYDTDFHVKELRKRIVTDQNYVLDDVRFPNELRLLKNMGAHCFFIIRPGNFDYSNHTSEISLTRRNFDIVIVNNRTLNTFKNKFKRSLNRLFAHSHRFDIDRNQFIKMLAECNYNTTRLANRINCSRDKIAWWANNYWIYLTQQKYTRLNDSVFSTFNQNSAYYAGLFTVNGTLKSHQTGVLWEFASTDKELTYGMRDFLQTDKHICCGKRGTKDYYLTLSNPFLIDDMKLWNLRPQKSMQELPSRTVLEDDNLFSAWVVGLIDGDGSIYTSNGNIFIKPLATLPIIKHIKERYGVRCGNWCQEKSNGMLMPLYSLCYSGKYAVEFYKKVYSGFGLSRKWDLVKPFLNKAWYQ